MKKYLLSVGLVITFTAYAMLYKQNTAPGDVAQTPPTSISEPVVTDSTTPQSPAPIKTTSTNTNTAVKKTPVVASSPVKAPTGQYKDGTYIGNSVDVYYGIVQVKAMVAGGKLSDVIFLSYPQDRSHSLQLSNRAMPILKSEAIQSQSSNVNTVSGATDTSSGFVQSLQSALVQAKNV